MHIRILHREEGTTLLPTRHYTHAKAKTVQYCSHQEDVTAGSVTHTQLSLDVGLFVQDEIQQGTMNFDTAIVMNETQFSKSVHEKTHTGSGCSDHLRECLLADLRDYRLRLAFLAKVRQQQEQPGKAFFARIEQLIDKVGFDTEVSAKEMRNEHLGECRFLMDHAKHSRFFKPHVRHRPDRGYTLNLAGEASFAEEFVRSLYCDNGFLALP